MCWIKHSWIVLKSPDTPVYSGVMEYRHQVSWQVETPAFILADHPNFPRFLQLPLKKVEDRFCEDCGKVELNLQKSIKKAVQRQIKKEEVKKKMPALIEMFWEVL